MTAIEALEALRALEGGDKEIDHSSADDILLAFLRNHDPACKDVANAYDDARERIGFWYA